MRLAGFIAMMTLKTALVSLAAATLAPTVNTMAVNAGMPNASTAQNDRGARYDRTAAPFTVTGCLQRDGRTFIVTHLNEPAQKNAGATGNAAAVEREQIRSAANAYRVSPTERMDLAKMVGKQVRVSGTMERSADLPRATGSADRRKDIDKGDLAEIKASAVTLVAENCGVRGGRP
jgi:hypothetical protein